MNAQGYVALNDLGTYSETNGAAVVTLNEQNEVRVYDLKAIIDHLAKNDELDQFLTNWDLDDDIIEDLDVDQTNVPLTQILLDGTRKNLNIEN